MHQCQVENSHKVLVIFMDRYIRLKAGGILLPSLIEFYQWIHTDFAHVITRKNAASTICSDAIEEAASKYPEHIEQHYKRLYEKVQG